MPDGTASPLLRVTDVKVGFRTVGGTVSAVNGVSFTVERGETLVRARGSVNFRP